MINSINDKGLKVELKKELTFHFDKITKILIQKPFIITTSLDATCVVIDINTYNKYKTLSFSPDSETRNLCFRGIIYNKGTYITLQSPQRGASYLTLWNEDFTPLKSVKIFDSTCISLEKISNYLVVGEFSGNVLQINIDTFSIIHYDKFHILAVNSIANVNNSSYFTGSSDQMVMIHHKRSSSIWKIINAFLILLLSVFIYILKNRNDEILNS